MRLATLVTNTDFSDFARARPLDDAKFAALIAEVRPDWQVTAFWVCRGEFPDSLAGVDGVMITGSPASVTDGADWMVTLGDLIVRLIAARTPLFGACFGHQAIGKALGSPILRNPDCWAHGLIEVTRTARAPWSGPEERFALHGSHVEQVGALPEGATRLFESPGCPVAGFALGTHVFTIQHHPEMTREFMQDLVEEYADHVGPEVTAAARRSLAQGEAHRRGFAEEIAAFFEQARR
jgi:GMP synthase-like glutamine amidotransferase